MQDPATRRYWPNEHLIGNDHLDEDEIYVDAHSFVRARCHGCQNCGCSRQAAYLYKNFRPHDWCVNQAAHGKIIIIAIASACHGLTAACGMFFKINSVHNKAFSFSSHQLHIKRLTSQIAGLAAAIDALETLHSIYLNSTFRNEEFAHGIDIIIKPDFENLVSDITDWIADWRVTGYLNLRDNILDDHKFCIRLNEVGLMVRFWLVPRECNRPAIKLANTDFNGRDPRTFSADDWFAGGRKPSIF